MSEYLFLYGTLMPGQAPAEVAGVVHQLRRVGPGYVRGHLYDLGDYPGAILDKSTETLISGEVFELPANQVVLASLDSYEGFDPAAPDDSLFIRISSRVTLSDGRQIECWIYVYNRDPGAAPLVVGGDYAKSRVA